MTPARHGQRRLIAWMQAHPAPVDTTTLAEAIHLHRRQIQYLLRQLHTAEPRQVYIAQWRKSTGTGARGRPIVRLWKLGDRPDAQKPADDDYTTIRRRRVRRLTEAYGARMASKILYSDAQVISLDGKLYHKDKPRGRSGGKRVRRDGI